MENATPPETDIDDKVAVTVAYSIGLLSRENKQTLSELGEELTQAGYAAEVGISPPSGQFSVTASLEHILIGIAAIGGAGGAVFSKKYLELAAEYVWKQTEQKLPKLKPRKPETVNLAIVVTVEIDGLQVKNILFRGPDDIKEFPTRPDRPHGHIVEANDGNGVIIRRSDGSAEQRWTPPQ